MPTTSIPPCYHEIEAATDSSASVTLKGGILGGLAGLALGSVGVYGATVRYPAFRQLTVPLRAFLVTSSGTFGGR